MSNVGLFVATGVMSNQLAVKSLVQLRPDIVLPEIICDYASHVYKYESGGLGYHSRIQAFPLAPANNLTYITSEQIKANIHTARDLHQSITIIVSLEVPSNGKMHLIFEVIILNVSKKKKKKKNDSFHLEYFFIRSPFFLKGTVMPTEEIRKISQLCKDSNLFLHCDGARLFNASVLTDISVHEYGKYFDTVSICLSKGKINKI